MNTFITDLAWLRSKVVIGCLSVEKWKRYKEEAYKWSNVQKQRVMMKLGNIVSLQMRNGLIDCIAANTRQSLENSINKNCAINMNSKSTSLIIIAKKEKKGLNFIGKIVNTTRKCFCLIWQCLKFLLRLLGKERQWDVGYTRKKDYEMLDRKQRKKSERKKKKTMRCKVKKRRLYVGKKTKKEKNIKKKGQWDIG